MTTTPPRLEDTKRNSFIGLSRQDLDRYSLIKVCRSLMRGEPIKDGIEFEASRECELRHIQRCEGQIMVPFDVPLSSARRDLNVNTFGSGGAFVATTVDADVVPILRNKMHTRRLGLTLLDGLSSNVALPRQTSTATVSALGETVGITPTSQTIDQVILAPHRIGAAVKYSKQLLMQSSVSVEKFVRDDLLAQIAVKWDKLVLEGQGANSEPNGVLNTIGIGSITFGAAASWSKVIAYETSLAQANADIGTMAFITTPNAKSRWKQIAKIGSTYPVFLWEKGGWKDGSGDGEVNGYRAAATNQISNDAAVFGSWSDAVMGLFGTGIELNVNPYTFDTSAQIQIVANSWIDVAVRHPACFCWSTDSAAQ